MALRNVYHSLRGCLKDLSATTAWRHLMFCKAGIANYDYIKKKKQPRDLFSKYVVSKDHFFPLFSPNKYCGFLHANCCFQL